MESVATVSDLFTRAEFLVGLMAGGAVTAFFIGFGAQENRRGWGLGVVVAATVTISFLFALREGLILGLAVLAVGGWLLDRPRHSPDYPTGDPWRVLAWGLIAVGSVIVTYAAGVEVSPVVAYASPLVVVGGGFLLGRWQDSPHRALLGPLFAITSFGIWVTVPETDLARILLGVSLALAPATLSWAHFRRISTAGGFAVVGLVVWVAAMGGEAREASIVGSWGALGMLALTPLLGRRSQSLSSFAIVALHTALVFLFTRVIGLWTDPGLALVAALFLVAAAYAGFAVFIPSVEPADRRMS